MTIANRGGGSRIRPRGIFLRVLRASNSYVMNWLAVVFWTSLGYEKKNRKDRNRKYICFMGIRSHFLTENMFEKTRWDTVWWVFCNRTDDFKNTSLLFSWKIKVSLVFRLRQSSAWTSLLVTCLPFLKNERKNRRSSKEDYGVIIIKN